MIGLLTGVHVLIALVLILIVLLQSAKGTDVGSAFGGMGSQAAFGPRGTATFLSKATVGLAIAFMVTSVTLTVLGRQYVSGSESVLSGEETAPAETATAPETPPAAAAPPGAGGISSPVEGMPGVQATITVENPEDAPAPAAPAATTPPDAAPVPEAPPAEPAPAP
ncbi:MAG: preprotein translocase subunit SecG [Acidobacteria bacterium]|nr:preprotein translocase subunit SecG [Acidobacteriota bacterium]